VGLGILKLCNDLRWLSSGPATGLAEISLPALQPGSSIMPGKVNPVVPEAVAQIVAQVVGNDAAVAFGSGQAVFQLDVMMPMTVRNVLESVELLAAGARLLADKAVDGFVVDEARMGRYAGSSPAIATALNPLLGYEAVAGVVHRALASGRTIREVVLDEGLLDAATLDAALDVPAMAGISSPSPASPPRPPEPGRSLRAS
jgi:fumarate hydratase class II